MGASRDEIFPNFLKYTIDENGRIDEKNMAIKNNKYLLGLLSLKIRT